MKHSLPLTFVFVVANSFAATAPAIDHIVSASGFGAFPGVAAPASWIEIYGTNLAGTTRSWATSDFTGSNAPTSLDGVTVTVNGTPAYLSYVSPTQINAQVPGGIPLGSDPVVVSYLGQSSAASAVVVSSSQPGLLAPLAYSIAGKQYAAVVPVGSSNPAGAPSAPVPAGATVVFYGVGFGPVTPNAPAGQLAAGASTINAAVSMTIGNLPAAVSYAGVAPGAVGLYQFNVAVPAGLAAGDQTVQIALNGKATSQTLSLAVGSAAAGGGGGGTNTFTLTSTAGANNGSLPAAYTCDGTGSTIPLAWSGAPAATREFALLMTTLPGDGTTKWNWVLYRIPATTTNLLQDSFLIGTLGVGSDGPGTVYNPPCSQGPGSKLYTYTLYALSGSPAFSVPASQVTGQMVTDAIASLTLSTATLNLSYARTTATGSSTACGYIGNSLRASKSGTASVACDGTYGYISSIGITTAPMMNGITSTNLQIPTPQNFQGAKGWKIPLNPAIAASPTSVVDGPLGVAINGVPIFNPCTQGGCVTGGDTKVLGQLDVCNGHAGRADDYHYHAAPVCMMADQPAGYWDTHPLGWALDGFAIFGYNDATGKTAARDAICGGNTNPVPNAPAGYAYHVTDASPYITGCLIGTPSPDLPNQGSKYTPLRQPPVTPFNDTAMMLTTDATDGYQVLQFTSALKFTTTETGTDSYPYSPGTYKIRYKQVTPNAKNQACWNFQFVDNSGNTTQPAVTYCK